MVYVKLEGVSKSFLGGKIKVLRDVNLMVERGRKVAVMGVSGSGKTTLLSIIGTILKPDSGKVLLDGTDVTDLGEDELISVRRKIGFVFQNGYLIPELNVIENVAFFAVRKFGKRIAFELAEEILHKLGISNLKHKNVWELSGGEYQRVALARALCYKPSLLLADEPTGNLDPQTALKVVEETVKLCEEEKVTLILVTHNRQVASIMDEVFSIEGGRLRRVEKAEFL